MHSRQNEEMTGQELYAKVAPWVVIVVVLLGGWLFRDKLNGQLNQTLAKSGQRALPALGLPPASLPANPLDNSLNGPVESPQAVAPRKDTVYRWVDKDGVTHYEQQEGHGREAVEVDQGQISSLKDYQGPVR